MDRSSRLPLQDAATARRGLASRAPHYVYVLCRGDGTPFYVGKGVQLRCFHHEAEAANTERLTHKLNLLRAMRRRGEAVRYCIESAFDTEVEAHAVNRRPKRTPYRRAKGTPFVEQLDGYDGRTVRAGCGVGRA